MPFIWRKTKFKQKTTFVSTYLDTLHNLAFVWKACRIWENSVPFWDRNFMSFRGPATPEPLTLFHVLMWSQKAVLSSSSSSHNKSFEQHGTSSEKKLKSNLSILLFWDTRVYSTRHIYILYMCRNVSSYHSINLQTMLTMPSPPSDGLLAGDPYWTVAHLMWATAHCSFPARTGDESSPATTHRGLRSIWPLALQSYCS